MFHSDTPLNFAMKSQNRQKVMKPIDFSQSTKVLQRPSNFLMLWQKLK